MKKDNRSFTVMPTSITLPIKPSSASKSLSPNISTTQINDQTHSLFEQAVTRLDPGPRPFEENYLVMIEPSQLYELVVHSAHWLTAQELSKKMEYKGRHFSSWLNKLKKRQQVFAITVDGEDLFPTYAFGLEGNPLPIMEKVLILLSQKKTPLTIAIWFSSSNGWLNGKPPQEVLATHPEEVFFAAQAETKPIDHS